MDFPAQLGPTPPVVSAWTVWGTISAAQVNDGGGAAFGDGTAPAANQAVFFPIGIPFWFNLRLFFWRNGATVAGNVDVGLYSIGGTKIASTGSTAMSGASTSQSAAPSGGVLIIPPGAYYLAFVTNSATATFPKANGPSMHGGAGVASQTTAFPLPATAAFTAGVSASFALLFGMADVGVI